MTLRRKVCVGQMSDTRPDRHKDSVTCILFDANQFILHRSTALTGYTVVRNSPQLSNLAIFDRF